MAILGFIDLCDLFKVPLGHQAAEAVGSGSADGGWDDFLETDNQRYLARDDKILSLVKEKQGREPAIVRQQSFFSLFQANAVFSNSRSGQKLFRYLSEAVSKKMASPVLKEIAGKLQAGTQIDLVAELGIFWGDEMPEVDPELDLTSKRVLRSIARGQNFAAIRLRSGEETKTLVLDPPLPKKYRRGAWSIKGEKGCCQFTDAKGVSESLLYVLIDQAFQEHQGTLNDEERMQDVVCRSLHEYLLEKLKPHLVNDQLMVHSEVHGNFPEISDYLERHGIGVLPVPESLRDQESREIFQAVPLEMRHLYLFLPYCGRIPRCNLFGAAVPYGYYYGYWDVYQRLFMLLYAQWNTREHTKSYLKDLARQSATVYMTKKNIPEKYQKAMRQSRFNDFFRYVEIDEDCDLGSVAEIEKEFVALKQECFDMKRYDAEIRFRKLGRHHAAGLYYPNRRCLCVDIRTPYSFGHEYLHMIDYFNGKLSEKYDFHTIRGQYEGALRDFIKTLPDGDPAKKVLNGNTKYNLSYYLEPTEIFARTGEIYFTKIMGVDNSLMRPNHGFAYPNSRELMESIEHYFRKLFGEGRTDNDGRSGAGAAAVLTGISAMPT